MAQDYRPLPSGPVLCKACSQAGKKVHMHPHDDLPPEVRQAHEDVDLQSYRCPECEAVEVFRVD